MCLFYDLGYNENIARYTESRAETSDGVGDKKEDSGPASSDVTSPTAAPTAQEPVKAKRREIVKKTKVELLPPLTAPQVSRFIVIDV